MGESNDKMIKAIKHYQESLERHTKTGKREKLLHAIERLASLPIRVWHLEETGVGRTVNGLKRHEGEVGDSARNLVDKWKCMVKEEEEKEQARQEAVEQQQEFNEPESIEEEEDPESLQIVDREENVDNDRSQETDISSHKKSEKDNKNGDGKKRRHSSDKSDSYNRSKKLKSSNRSERSSESSDNSVSEDESEKSVKAHPRKGSQPSNSRRSDSESSYDSSSDDSDSDHSSESEEENRRHKQSTRDKSKYKSSKSDKNSDRSSKDKKEEKKSKYNNVTKTDKKSKETRSEKDKSNRDKESHRSKSREHMSDNEKSSKKSSSSVVVGSGESSKSSSKSKEPTRHERKDSSRDKKASKSSSKGDKDCRGDTKKSDLGLSPAKEGKKSKGKSSREKTSSSSKSKQQQDEKKDRHKTEKINCASNNASSSSSKKNKQSSTTQLVNGIDSACGASFEDVLGMLEAPVQSKSKKKCAASTDEKPSSSKSSGELTKLSNNKTLQETQVPSLLKESTLEPLDINISSLLPPITPNYRPLGMPLDAPSKRIWTDGEALTRVIAAKHQRTKVYSGNKSAYTKVPSLFELCSRILQDNLDAMEYTGGVPYSILKHILEKANPDQLYQLEFHNPYLIEDTDELWQLHCQKEFRNKKREEMESWREMYMRCLDEREARLKALTANIKQSQDKSTPVRQTKLAYVDSFVKPPRNIARKQAKNGLAVDIKKPSQTPTERLNQLAKSGEASKVAVPNPVRVAADRGSSSSSASHLKPKKAPLMAKTLSLLKSFGRR